MDTPRKFSALLCPRSAPTASFSGEFPHQLQNYSLLSLNFSCDKMRITASGCIIWCQKAERKQTIPWGTGHRQRQKGTCGREPLWVSIADHLPLALNNHSLDPPSLLYFCFMDIENTLVFLRCFLGLKIHSVCNIQGLCSFYVKDRWLK